jgi:toxin ParE1/3/4
LSWEVRRTRRAEADLVDIWIYIAADSPAAAERVIRRLEAAEGRLAQFPEMAPLREELLPGVRAWAVGEYLIFYRVDPDAVEILRILHGARDLGDLLGD